MNRNIKDPSFPHAVGGNPQGTERIWNINPVSMLASRRNGALYIGVTSTSAKRIREHKTDVVAGFSKLHAVHTLVWYDIHEAIDAAIRTEKMLKKWRIKWKIRLINSFNPEWQDLYGTIV